MATPLSLILSGGFSALLAAALTTILILMFYERKLVAQNNVLRWSAFSAIAFIVVYSIVSKPFVFPLTLASMLFFMLPFTFAGLIMIFLKGKDEFVKSTRTIIVLGLVIMMFLSVSYAIGDKILSVSQKDIVLGTGAAAFSPFSPDVLGMALLLTFGALLMYSSFSFTSKS
jgi:hypothetical protein